MNTEYDAIILGGGGAGLMCAAVAGQGGKRVLVIDHADEVGKKILISGGGRCNFTNVGAVPGRYISANPHFARSAMGRYTPADFIAMVDAAHALGFKVILDWVANHTSHDHHWTREHPDWHTRRADGSLSRPIDPAGKETDWDDVADLNYGNRDMRTAMIGEMRWWLDSTGIDGFRCDVVGFVPYDFWAAARAASAKS